MTEIRIDYSLGDYQGAVNSALEKIRQDNFIERIRAKDYTLWKPRPDEIVNRLGWLDAPVETLAKIHDICVTSDALQKDKISDIVLIGMGGSSLAAEVFGKIFGSKPGYPCLHVIDTTDPVFISEVTQHLNLEKTLFLVSSKSGSTLEITSLLKYFYNLCLKNSGSEAGRQFIFITDEGSPLVKTAESISARYIFLNNPDIGGRFSALSLPGIVPAALIGIDAEKLLQTVSSNMEILMNTGVSLGAMLGILATKGLDKLTLILPMRWKSFGDWLEQLLAESTGKEGKGILPVLDKPLKDISVYGKDRVFIVFRHQGDTQPSPTESLMKSGHPVNEIQYGDDYDLGQQMYIWEMATAVAAHFMGVNPFDQPDVETTKKHTRTVIANLDNRSDDTPAITFEQGAIFGNIIGQIPAEALGNFLKRAIAGDYICLQNYLSPSPEIDAAVNRLREMLARKYVLPVICGYGPRYLHSTGQLHKGDSGNGLFIQLTQNYALDLDIPDEIGREKSSLSFGALKDAQAKGDFQALTEKKRRIIRIHFKKDPTDGLNTIVNFL